VQTERSHPLDSGWIQGAEIPAQCRTRRPAIPSNERPQRAGPGLKPLVKGFPRPFATDRRADKHGHTIDPLRVAEAATGKTPRLFDGRKPPLAFERVSEHRHFPEPIGS
jgi:hypothetical protein